MSEMRYYKATRPNGTDLRTGTVDYGAALKSGAVLEHPAKFCRNNPATYFSVSIAPTDCTGMRWPCRLFRVEPVGRAWRNDVLPSKRCCSRLRVVEELPAHEAFGPQGREVAALIERAGRLTADEIAGLRVAGVAARVAAWEAAGVAAWEAARVAAWVAARVAAGEAARVAAGVAAGVAAREAAGVAAWEAAGVAARVAAWVAAREAAWVAALALLTRDLITPEQFDALYGPWRVIGDDDE